MESKRQRELAAEAELRVVEAKLDEARARAASAQTQLESQTALSRDLTRQLLNAKEEAKARISLSEVIHKICST